MVDCFSTHTEGVEGTVSLVDVERLGLKMFCTFNKAFLCF